MIDKIVLYGLYLITSVLVFGVIVLVHELGHFTVAKLAGVHVYEFSIGFGPRLAGFKKRETSYNLRVIPLGGYVRMAGMDPEEDQREAARSAENEPEFAEESHGPDEKGKVIPVVDQAKSFSHKSVPQRMAIIASGPIMNFILAIILFALTIWISGLPDRNIVGQVMKGKPADVVGIREGDRINKINNKPVKVWEDIIGMIHNSPNKRIKLEIGRGQETRVVYVTPEIDRENNIGLIGIIAKSRKPGVFESLKSGAVQSYTMLSMTADFIRKMMARQIPVQLSGPVRITYELGKAAQMGLNKVIYFAGILSLQIGLFNLLPFPALDGSRLMFLGVEGIRGMPIDPSKENFIHLVGLALLLLLMVVITYQDIAQMIS